MQIVDNFVNPIFQDQIEQIISYPAFTWNYNKCGTQSEYDTQFHFIDEKTVDSAQFTHKLNNDNYYDSYITKYLVHCMEEYFGRNFSDRLVRVKVNMLLKDSTYKVHNYHIPHVDWKEETESAIYYVNDSDGDTFFFNEKPNQNFTNITVKQRVTPRKGRLVLFDSSYLHASSSPIINNERIIINLVFSKPN
jgi:hypothetical protein